MKITDFAKAVSVQEGLKKQVNIAQILEVIRVINQITSGALYKIIRSM
jgi:hypothetical protein